MISGEKSYPKVSVVVAVYNRIHLTKTFLQNFTRVTYPNYELIIVDDGSTDGTSNMIMKEFSYVRILKREGNLWWSKATNIGVSDATLRGADYILIMNDDVVFEPDFLFHLVAYAEAHPRAIVGSIIYDFNNRSQLWYAGGKRNLWAGELQHRASLNDDEIFWLTGMGTLLPVQVFEEVGFYDDKRFPQYSGDADLSIRARKQGYSLAIEPKSILWNKTEDSGDEIIRRGVTLKTLFTPLFSRRSVSKLSVRVNLYWRYWPALFIPIGFISYYMRFFIRQILYFLKLR